MIYLPPSLPCIRLLRDERHAVSEENPPRSALRILLLNLMPQKTVTEYDIARAVSHSGLHVALYPVKISGQTYKTTPVAHMERFYSDFETCDDGFYDGLVVTGAPVEQLAFEEVRYWRQLQRIMDWAVTHVRSTLYICWGAQAALYHRYGISKQLLPAKKFGVFAQTVHVNHPLTEGLFPSFPMPVSRHTALAFSEKNLAQTALPDDLILVASGEKSGAGILLSGGGREVYVTGHLEYAGDTLHKEYERDCSKGLPISAPAHYYDASGRIVDSWREACRTFYRNWLTACVSPGGDSPRSV